MIEDNWIRNPVWLLNVSDFYHTTKYLYDKQLTVWQMVRFFVSKSLQSSTNFDINATTGRYNCKNFRHFTVQELFFFFRRESRENFWQLPIKPSEVIFNVFQKDIKKLYCLTLIEVSLDKLIITVHETLTWSFFFLSLVSTTIE